MNRNKQRPYVLILIPVLIQAINTALFKTAALGVEELTVVTILTYPFYWFCLGLLAVRAFFYQWSLKHFPLSQVYPFRSLTYPAILAISYWYFEETVTWYHLTGAALIVAGVMVYAKGVYRYG